MKISMMSYTIARGLNPGEEFDVKGLCEFSRELDLEAIDWVSTYGHEAAEIRRITDDYGLRNICHTFQCDLDHPTAEGREAGREEFRRGIERTVTLGADKIMLPVPGSPDFTREESFRYYTDGLNEVMPFARGAGITVTVEHFPNPRSPFISSEDVNRAIERVPGLKVTFDNGNVTTAGEDPDEAFRNSADDIVHAHFKDFEICPEGTPGSMPCLDGQHRRRVLVGDGDVDQLSGLRAMKECGYEGYINFEYEGSEYTPHDATVEGVARLRSWIASLEE